MPLDNNNLPEDRKTSRMPMPIPRTLLKALALFRNRRGDTEDVRRHRRDKRTKTTKTSAADTRYLQLSSPPTLSYEGNIIPDTQKSSSSPITGLLDDFVSERYGGWRRGKDRRLLHGRAAAKDAIVALSDDENSDTGSESCARISSERSSRKTLPVWGSSEKEIVLFATFGSCLEEGGVRNSEISLEHGNHPTVSIVHPAISPGVDGYVIAPEEVRSLRSMRSRSLTQQLKPEAGAIREAHAECETEQIDEILSSREVVIQRKLSGESGISTSRSVIINFLVGNRGEEDVSRDEQETHLAKMDGRVLIGEKGQDGEGNPDSTTHRVCPKSRGGGGGDTSPLPVANDEAPVSTSGPTSQWGLCRMEFPFECDCGRSDSHDNKEGNVRDDHPSPPPREAEDSNTAIANHNGRRIKAMIVNVPDELHQIDRVLSDMSASQVSAGKDRDKPDGSVLVWDELNTSQVGDRLKCMVGDVGTMMVQSFALG